MAMRMPVLRPPDDGSTWSWGILPLSRSRVCVPSLGVVGGSSACLSFKLDWEDGPDGDGEAGGLRGTWGGVFCPASCVCDLAHSRAWSAASVIEDPACMQVLASTSPASLPVNARLPSMMHSLGQSSWFSLTLKYTSGLAAAARTRSAGNAPLKLFLDTSKRGSLDSPRTVTSTLLKAASRASELGTGPSRSLPLTSKCTRMLTGWAASWAAKASSPPVS
mmetsp:Transcript_20605/g.51912  ORF Transcript_20605/g.51912 Transcript_20605/m.51912 type:complete len:220 (-) Transcript_20605:322-981(-)